MPYHYFKPTDASAVHDDDLAWRRQGYGLGIRVDYLDTKELFDEVEVILPGWSAESFESLWAIEPVVLNLPDVEDLYDAVLQEHGAIDCKLSVDDGSTWLYWDGAAWSAAGATDWTNFTDLNTNLTAIPFTTYQLRFTIRLRRGADTTTGPVLRGIRMGYSLLANHDFEDAMRTVKRWVKNNLSVDFRDTFPAGGANTLTLDHLLTVLSASAVYDLTADPTRQTNLYAGTFTGKTLDLISSPTAANSLEVTWKAACPVYMWKRDPDFADHLNTHSPCVVVQFSSGSEDDFQHNGTSRVITKNIPLTQFWKEPPGLALSYRFFCRALAASEGLAARIADAVYGQMKVKSQSDFMNLVKSGAEAEITDFSPPFEDASDVTEGLSVKSFSAILSARKWCTDEVETGVLATESIILIEDLIP